MVPLQPIFKKAYWSLVGFGALYGALLVSLSFKPIQRHALYLHKAQSEYFHNLDKPESLGFAKNQITPFTLPTPDGEDLFGWHILPIGIYAQHEEALLAQTPTAADPYKHSLAFELLRSDPAARVVINFHGNAGNLGQGYRPQTYKSLTSASSSIHVLTVDYRGFGRSSGIPSEAGLIQDGIALVNFVLSLGVPPERIVILGQSLGTQVAAAVALHFASPVESARLLPEVKDDINLPGDGTLLSPSPESKSITFASVILAASFPSLPQLLKVYRLSGLVPLLSPLRVYPFLQNLFFRFVHEKWDTAARLAALVSTATTANLPLNLQIMHAANDYDISWRMGLVNFETCVEALIEGVTTGKGKYEEVDVQTKGDDWGETMRKSVRYQDVSVEWTLLMSGGHNRIVADVPVALAVIRGFGL